MFSTLHSQLVLNSVAAGAAFCLIGLSFCLTYRIAKFFDMTPAVAFVVGAYAAFLVSNGWGTSAFVSICIGVVLAGVLGIAWQYYVLGSKSVSAARPAEKFLVSLGGLVVGQGMIALLFHDDTKILPFDHELPARIASASVTRVQLASIICAILLSLLLIAVEKFTYVGTLYRAVASDMDLSLSVGIPVRTLSLAIAAISASIAALGGILVGADVGLTPSMGFHAILMGMVAAIVGGIAGFEGVMLGAFVIGIIQNLVAFWLATVWQDAVVFMVLIVCLILRPQGIIGRPLRKAVV